MSPNKLCRLPGLVLMPIAYAPFMRWMFSAGAMNAIIQVMSIVSQACFFLGLCVLFIWAWVIRPCTKTRKKRR